MSGVISDQFGFLVWNDGLAQCINFLEDGLRSLKRTPYHRVLGKDFLPQANDLAKLMIDFHTKAIASKRKLVAIYLEMNGFAYNTKQWHCDLFGYKKAGERTELDWLAYWDDEGDETFVLRGMESVQKAFAELYCDKTQPLGVRLAGEIAEHLVTARFMELVALAHKTAKRRYAGLKGVAVLATAHDWDRVHTTE